MAGDPYWAAASHSTFITYPMNIMHWLKCYQEAFLSQCSSRNCVLSVWTGICIPCCHITCNFNHVSHEKRVSLNFIKGHFHLCSTRTHMVEYMAQISILCCHIAFSVKIVHHPKFYQGGIFLMMFIKELCGCRLEFP
jgi:hypothetical protein